MREERYTLSSLLREVLGIQDVLQQLYEKAAVSDKSNSYFQKFSKDIATNRNRIETVQSEGVIELALEPIPGEKINDLLSKIQELIPNNGGIELEKLGSIERLVARLFEEAAREIAPMSAEVSQLLLRASKQSKSRVEELSGTSNS